jgi:pimeloyl-ACP methyl ester carboxylesterase
MNNNLANHKSKTKKRKPLLAAFLSLISLGLGQVYNGELWKGIFLNLIFWSAFLLYSFYTCAAYFGKWFDLIFLLILVLIFLALKIYSVGQAFIHSRRIGKTYTMKKINHFLIYILFFVVLLVPPFFLSNAINQLPINDTSFPHPFRSKKARTDFLKLYDSRASQWPVDAETRTIQTSWGKTLVRISGPKQAPPLVLLHGGPSNSLQWIFNIEALSRDYQTFAIDIIIGTGRSINTKKIKNTLELIEWLDETLDGLGLEDNINIMGLSYGGWITSQYTLKHPDRLNKAILVAPAGTVAPLSLTWIKYAVFSMIPHPHFMENFFYWLMPDFVQKEKAEVARIIDESFMAVRCFKPRTLLNPNPLTDTELQSIQVPVLVMIGEREKVYARSAQKVILRLNSIAPQLKTLIIPGAGHDIIFIQADLVNRKILEFLK